MTKTILTKTALPAPLPRFYHFRQNNSFGAFQEPGINVYVEAFSPEDANDRATAHGIYFDGVSNDIDCDCCGDRWYTQYRDAKGMTRDEVEADIFETTRYFTYDREAERFVIITLDGMREVPGTIIHGGEEDV